MGELNPGIVICSRSDSTRIPNKPWSMVNGKYLISHLLNQVQGLVKNVVVATPNPDFAKYVDLLEKDFKDVKFICGFDLNPLGRTMYAADYHKLDPIIRITHDKVFIDRFALKDALNVFMKSDLEYLYSSNLIDGSGFEIISRETLQKAYEAFKSQNVEHISYAVKSVAKKVMNYVPPGGHFNKPLPDIRFLIDFEEDLDFIRGVFGYSVSKAPSLYEALETVEKYPFLTRINAQPEITIYTCVHNDQEYITWCIESVVSQTIFDRVEYIIIDDHSTDETYRKIITSKYFKKIKLKRNEKNIGLSSSSNIALNLARGKYIMRVDADDALLFPFTLEKMLKKAKQEGIEALYPTYIDQKTRAYKKGEDTHHAGGCLFLTKAIRNIQFTEKLRGWEGLDLFQRAKDHIKIGYCDELPAFFYRDKPNSMSKINIEERKEIKRNIEKNGFWVDPCITGVPV